MYLDSVLDIESHYSSITDIRQHFIFQVYGW